MLEIYSVLPIIEKFEMFEKTASYVSSLGVTTKGRKARGKHTQGNYQVVP